MRSLLESRHEISKNVLCATSKASDQPAHMRSLISGFVSRLKTLRVLSCGLNIIWSFLAKKEAAQADSILVKMPHGLKSHVVVITLFPEDNWRSNYEVQQGCDYLYAHYDIKLVKALLLVIIEAASVSFEVRPRGYKTFFMLNSTEHKIYHAQKCYKANNCWHLNIY